MVEQNQKEEGDQEISFGQKLRILPLRLREVVRKGPDSEISVVVKQKQLLT